MTIKIAEFRYLTEKSHACSNTTIVFFEIFHVTQWTSGLAKNYVCFLAPYPGLAMKGERSLSLASTHAWEISGDSFIARLESGYDIFFRD